MIITRTSCFGVPGSTYRDFSSFTSVLPEIYRDSTSQYAGSFLSAWFPISCSLINLSFSAMQCELLRGSLNEEIYQVTLLHVEF